jgi:hypothetical protein
VTDETTWLEPGTVTAVLGAAMSEQLDLEPLGVIVPAVRDYVEGKRGDLFVLDETVDPAVNRFVAPPSVVLGAAMLAHRLYARRTTPLGIIAATEDGFAGIIRDDPDIGRLLGIAGAGRFVFGASSTDRIVG